MQINSSSAGFRLPTFWRESDFKFAPANQDSFHPEFYKRFKGIANLYGHQVLARLAASQALVLGVGGVGSWAVESLTRSGFGSLVLVDNDDACYSNVNRQLNALDSTIAQDKTSILLRRSTDINPFLAGFERVELLQPGLANLAATVRPVSFSWKAFSPRYLLELIALNREVFAKYFRTHQDQTLAPYAQLVEEFNYQAGKEYLAKHAYLPAQPQANFVRLNAETSPTSTDAEESMSGANQPESKSTIVSLEQADSLLSLFFAESQPLPQASVQASPALEAQNVQVDSEVTSEVTAEITSEITCKNKDGALAPRTSNLQQQLQTLLNLPLPPAGFYVLDCIDQSDTKVALIEFARRNKLKLVVCGGAGGKFDPTKILVGDLSATTNDPLLAGMRNKLRREYGYRERFKGKFGVPVIYSTEQMSLPEDKQKCDLDALNCRNGYGSVTMVTASFANFACARVVDWVVQAAKK